MRLPLVLGLFLAPPLPAQTEPIAPPCAGEARRALDFWIGSWTVTDPDGKPAGRNEITRVSGSCGLLERWESPGANGSSFRGIGHHASVSPQAGGKLRQHGERSIDGGKSWSTTFDYVYTRTGG